MCLWFQAKIFWGPGAEKGTSTWGWALDIKVHLEIREEGGRELSAAEQKQTTKHETLPSL